MATPAKKTSAFMTPKNVSAELAVIVGKGPLPFPEVVSKTWIYIKANNLQDPKNKRNIIADEALKKVFKGKGTVTMFELGGLLFKNLS